MSTNFAFIVSSGPKLQDDPTVRAVIRKQAMRDVGLERRKQNSLVRATPKKRPLGKGTNARIQPDPSSESSEDGSTTVSSGSSEFTDLTEFDELLPCKTDDNSTVGTQQAVILPYSPTLATITLFTSYETARAKFQIDLVDLSMLTNFHVGHSTIGVLGKDRENLASLVGYRHWSYLQYVPTRYGTSDCITAATNCVLAKVKSILAPEHFKSQDILLRFYLKALQTLQAAISNPSTCLDADVLCATQLLSLHELLDPERVKAWSQHIRGATRLVKSRTPKRFETEFEKALFAAHVGPALTESIVQMTHCYLEDPEWTQLYESVVLDTKYLHERSSLTIDIRKRMFPVPGLWRDIDQAVNGQDLFNDDVLIALKDKCLVVQRDFLRWTEDYKDHCVRLSLTSPPESELALRRELFGTSLEGLILLKRLIATVCEEDRELLEIETQALARLLLELQETPSPKFSWLFSGHEVGIAYTAVHTKTEWEVRYDYGSEDERRLATRNRYNVWSNMLRKYD